MNYCENLVINQNNTPHNPAFTYLNSDKRVVSLTYSELLRLSGLAQKKLSNAGLKRGDRTLLILSTSITFYILLYAMLGAGIIPVIIERGLSLKKTRECLSHARLDAMLVMPDLAKKWFILPELWRVRRLSIGKKRLFMGFLDDISESMLDKHISAFDVTPANDDDTALITFTSGSTGLPKGAVRTHGSLNAQSEALLKYFPEKNQHDISSFPVLALFSHYVSGSSFLLPKSEPDGTINVELIIKHFLPKTPIRLSGSPAWISQLTNYASQHNLYFPFVKRVIIGGAPVTQVLIEGCLKHFPRAECGINYGSTEAEPISYIDMNTLLKEWSEHPGYLAGEPVEGLKVYIRPHPDLFDVLDHSDHGEILVCGPQVLKHYFENPEAERLHKITDSDGRFWHSTGDTGFLDNKGRIWLTGRLNDIIQTTSGKVIAPYILEKKLNASPHIRICGVIQSNDNHIGVVLQKHDCIQYAYAILKDLVPNENIDFFIVKKLPVDSRHHSRIDRKRIRIMLRNKKIKPFYRETLK